MPESTGIRQRPFVIAGLLLALLAGCARLPDYAMPRSGHLSDPALMADAFTYRQLQRSDFRAPSPPPESGGHSDVLQAHTCAQIRPAGDSRIMVSHSRYDQSPVYIGSIENLRFEAVMIPGCSWWNPAVPERQQAYVLQHEQIHFAIVEVSARRLTLRTREAAKKYLAVHSTLEAARAEVTATVSEWIKRAMDDSLSEHAAFDEETSLFPSRKRQQWWLDKIDGELAQLQGAAR